MAYPDWYCVTSPAGVITPYQPGPYFQINQLPIYNYNIKIWPILYQSDYHLLTNSVGFDFSLTNSVGFDFSLSNSVGFDFSLTK